MGNEWRDNHFSLNLSLSLHLSFSLYPITLNPLRGGWRNDRLIARTIAQRTNVYTSMFLLVFVCHKRARNGGSMCACARNGSGKYKIRCCTNSMQTKVYSTVFCSFELGLFGTNLIVKRRKKKRESRHKSPTKYYYRAWRMSFQFVFWMACANKKVKVGKWGAQYR